MHHTPNEPDGQTSRHHRYAQLADKAIASTDGHATDGKLTAITAARIARGIKQGLPAPRATFAMERSDGHTVHFFQAGGFR